MPPREERVTSRTNARVQLLRAAVAGEVRRSEGLIAAEGEHLVEEAVRSGVPPRMIFVAGDRPLPPWLPGESSVVRLPEELFRSAVETETPQGIAALLEPPSWPLQAMLAGASSATALVLVLAEVQDPGNVGTLFRSAEAFGATGVLLAGRTASVWSGKALRASAGSAFRLPSVRVSDARQTRETLTGLRLLATVGPSGAGAAEGRHPVRPIHQEDLARPTALLIGNEGAGLGPEWLAIADATTTIPSSGPVESLNAAIAGAVMLYEAQRQRTAKLGLANSVPQHHSDGRRRPFLPRSR